jgi:hypothetical protein
VGPGRHALLALLVACNSPAKPAAPQPAVAVAAGSASDPNDQCPNDPEDMDGFEDDDGCRDPDNDGDRIVDADDKCPNEPETFNDYEDDDGCPDRGCVIVNNMDPVMCFTELIFFDRGKDMPSIERYGTILDAAAEAMKISAGDIELVELRGLRGRGEPRTLSKQRASSIAQLLVARGVDASRLAIVDGGLAPAHDEPNGSHRVRLSIAKQRMTNDGADGTICTPMGPYFRRLTDEERAARCHR